MGVTCVINGGQTMNPSTEDFINAVESINAEHIIMIPNNGNVVLDRKIVVQGKSVGQGVDLGGHRIIKKKNKKKIKKKRKKKKKKKRKLQKKRMQRIKKEEKRRKCKEKIREKKWGNTKKDEERTKNE